VLFGRRGVSYGHSVPRDIDELWIEEAVDRYRRIDGLLAELDHRARSATVTVRSPDGLVEVLATADGTVRDVQLADSLAAYRAADVARAVRDTVTAALAAAHSAREQLHADTFTDYHRLG
jgi:DNA-binding protein YbaB